MFTGLKMRSLRRCGWLLQPLGRSFVQRFIQRSFGRAVAAMLFLAMPAVWSVHAAEALPPASMAADAPQSVANQSVANQSADTTPPLVPPVSSTGPDYVIGPGDTLQVFVWREADLSVTVPVRPDGKISTPLVEDMVAVGRTASQLAREIEKVLAEYIRGPQVSIIITNPVSTASQVRIIGEVTTPKAVPYREGLTVLDVVLEAGGLTEFAAGNRAKLVRQKEDGTSEEIKLRLEALVRKGKISENVQVRPGDVLIVPESFF